MRDKERIPIILSHFYSEPARLLADYLGISSHEANELFAKDKWNKITEYWLENYDQRLGQVIYNLNFITSDEAYNREEVNWLIQQGDFAFEELHFWGINYDKDNNLLEKPYKKTLQNLDDDHIVNIIKWFEGKRGKIKESYWRYFNERLGIKL